MKPNTVTIEVWAILSKKMIKNGYIYPDVSFDEPWQADSPDYKCRKFIVDIPDYFELRYDQTNGHRLLFNKHQDKYMVLPIVDHDMHNLTLITLDEDGCNDGKSNHLELEIDSRIQVTKTIRIMGNI